MNIFEFVDLQMCLLLPYQSLCGIVRWQVNVLSNFKRQVRKQISTGTTSYCHNRHCKGNFVKLLQSGNCECVCVCVVCVCVCVVCVCVCGCCWSIRLVYLFTFQLEVIFCQSAPLLSVKICTYIFTSAKLLRISECDRYRKVHFKDILTITGSTTHF